MGAPGSKLATMKLCQNVKKGGFLLRAVSCKELLINPRLDIISFQRD